MKGGGFREDACSRRGTLSVVSVSRARTVQDADLHRRERRAQRISDGGECALPSPFPLTALSCDPGMTTLSPLPLSTGAAQEERNDESDDIEKDDAECHIFHYDSRHGTKHSPSQSDSSSASHSSHSQHSSSHSHSSYPPYPSSTSNSNT
ncbi:hypothetical protein DFH07DRAFT_956514 [Mycena maculata]|uniref:Uncharacterized protein n=1 Tax=Mycena maculata TaxID=230809 RepID=A0AAD7JEE6_9AGAR|nr:hypothetical protein DFH07DRAFT_956514 [Mycena maculata]